MTSFDRCFFESSHSRPPAEITLKKVQGSLLPAALCSPPPPLFPRCRLHLRHRPRPAGRRCTGGAEGPRSQSGSVLSPRPDSPRSRFAGERGKQNGGAAARVLLAEQGERGWLGRRRERVLWELPPPPGPASRSGVRPCGRVSPTASRSGLVAGRRGAHG